MEIWKDIKGFESIYQISNSGQIRNKDFIMKQNIDKHGYKYICLSKNGTQKKYKVHRLVLEAFIGDGTNLVCNHIDKDRCNNNLSNLEWVTIMDNNIHKFKDKSKNVGVSLKNGKWYARVQINKTRVHLGYFENIKDAIEARISYLNLNEIVNKYN